MRSLDLDQARVQAGAELLPNAELWPNKLGLNTLGSDGKVYEVWYPIKGLWRVRAFGRDGYPETYGTGDSMLQALANAHDHLVE